MLSCMVSCEDMTSDNDSEHGVDPKPKPKPHKSIQGVIQKGPFIDDIEIMVYQLDDKLMDTGTGFKDYMVTDYHLGKYAISDITSEYIEIEAVGRYFNEVTGEISSSLIYLKTIARVTDDEPININVLTSLTSGRIRTLVSEGLEFNEAMEIAENEVLAIFGDTTSIEMMPFNSLSIAEEGEANALLLAASIKLQSNRYPEHVQELMDQISSDIEVDGELQNESLINELDNGIKSLDLKRVRTNIENYYSKGESVTIPEFEKYTNFGKYDWLFSSYEQEYILSSTAQDLELLLNEGVEYDYNIMYVGEKDWITFDRKNLIQPFSIKQNENEEERFAQIYFTSEENSSKVVIYITQKPEGSLIISSDTYDDISAHGEIIEVKFATNSSDFEITIDSKSKSWIEDLTISKSMVDYTKRYRIHKNGGLDPRIGKIIVSSSDYIDTITINQKGSYEFEISGPDKMFSNMEQTFEIDVNTNKEYTLDPPVVDWITIEEQNNKYITVKLSQNTTGDERSSKLMFKGFNGTVLEYVVTQSQTDIIEGDEKITIDNKGGNFDVNLAANQPLSFEINCDWIKAVPSSKAMEDFKFTFTATSNALIASRTAEIKFIGGATDIIVKVTQTGGDSKKALTGVTYGSLKDLMNEDEVLNITELSIEGSLNGDDCNLISTMVKLVKLDLSKVLFENNILPENSFSLHKEQMPIKELILPTQKTEFPTGSFTYFRENLERLDIGGTEVIADFSFSSFAKLTEVNLRNVKEIGLSAFKGAGLVNLTIPNSVTLLKESFMSCEDLVTIDIAGGIKVIDNTFKGCTSLQSIVIPEGVEALIAAFSNCTSLSDVKLPSTLKVFESDPYAASGAASSQLNGSFRNTAIKTIDIPESVVDLGPSTFQYCKQLTKVNFSKNTKITKIYGGESVHFIYGNVTWVGPFYECSALEEMTIPASVEEISGTVFMNSGLKRLYFEEGSKLTNFEGGVAVDYNGVSRRYIYQGCFAGAEQLTEVVLPPSLTKLGDNLFKGCKINSLSLPYITQVGMNVFSSSTIDRVELPNITEVGYRMFVESTVKRLDMQNVKNIGKEAFLNAKELVSVSFPNVIAIRELAFKGCLALNSISFPNVTEVENNAFENNSALNSVSLPKVAKLGYATFRGCKSLTSISLPTVRKLSGATFKECTNLMEIDLPNLCEISSEEFLNSPALATMTFPKLEIIGDGAFKDSPHFTEVTEQNFPAVKEIGYEAFKNCINITDVSLPNATVVFGFFGCPALEKVSLPNVEEVSGFEECTALKTISLPNVNSVAGFRGCTSLVSIHMPKVTSIEYDTFLNCTSLKELSTLDNLYSLKSRAFSGCSSLESVSMPSLIDLTEHAFLNCTSLRSASFASVNVINEEVFKGCSALKILDLPKLTIAREKAFSGVSLESLTISTYGTKSKSLYLRSSEYGEDLSLFANTENTTLNIGNDCRSYIKIDHATNTLTVKFDTYKFKKINVIQ